MFKSAHQKLWKQKLGILARVISKSASQRDWQLALTKQYFENQLVHLPHFRFIPFSTKLLSSALRTANPKSEVICCLLRNVDPTDGQSYESLELAARLKHWHLVRLFVQHPSVQTEDAFEKIKSRSVARNGLVKDGALLQNLETIFNS